MIWLLLLVFLTPYPWRLARMFFPQGNSPKAPETWEQRKARVAFENRSRELGQRYFSN